MKTIILGNSLYNLRRVYPQCVVDKINTIYDLNPDFCSAKEIFEDKHLDTEIIFSTWGMPKLSIEDINRHLPKLQSVFYAAGSVQDFAQTFLASGVRVFSAWKANAVPVAEFTFAEILLSTKGYFKAAKRFCPYGIGARYNAACNGNYQSKIGILGVGGVGSLVAERLKTTDLEVYAYDPFLSDEKATELNIIMKPIEWIFANCNVVSNHLANKQELNKILDYELFSSMPKYSVFINTGRGAQVDERGLAKALWNDRTKYAVLDVTAHEPLSLFSPLRLVSNKIITPHIAGSSGHEVVRMSELMLSTSIKVTNGESVDNEVTPIMLSTMA